MKMSRRLPIPDLEVRPASVPARLPICLTPDNVCISVAWVERSRLFLIFFFDLGNPYVAYAPQEARERERGEFLIQLQIWPMT